MALEEKVFAVVDLETTGFKADQDSIFEIGIIYFKNGEIIEEYHQLIHPEKTIPNAIIQLTKITPSTLQEAPNFETIAKSLHSKLKDCIIVAHQISFDFSFLKNAFEKQGLAFHPKKLCTLKLAKHLFPELPNHKINTINEFLQLGFKELHQAHTDALIALEILKLGIRQEPEYLLEAIRFDRQQLFPPKIDKKLLFELPTDAGVYFFHDDRGKILYIGKAKNIQKRVLNHFDQGSDSQQKQSMIQQIADIKVEQTHGELLALLKENQYIKKNWPPYNAAQKQGAKRFDLIGIENRGGELNLELVKKSPYFTPLISFENEGEGRQFMRKLVVEQHICGRQAGLFKKNAQCKSRGDSCCSAPCNGQRFATTALKKILRQMLHQLPRLLIWEGGPDKYNLIVVNQGNYEGYGTFDSIDEINFESARKLIQPQIMLKEDLSIIQRFEKKAKIIEKKDHQVWLIPPP